MIPSEISKKGSDVVKLWVMICAPLLAVVAGWLAHNSGMNGSAALTLGIAIWTALWWIFEAVPIPVASLVPLALLPLLGVLSAKQVAEAYGHKLVLLLLGGLLISKAMEKSGAHRRIALKMVTACGGGGGRCRQPQGGQRVPCQSAGLGQRTGAGGQWRSQPGAP